MKRVYSNEYGLAADYIKNILQQEGIDSVIKNHNLSGGVGELPPIECWTEVWILQDTDYSRACGIIADVLKESARSGEPWVCACGEKIEAQFTDCWHCGTGHQDRRV